MPGAYLYGWDGAAWRKGLVDLAGHLQVDVITAGATVGHCYGWDTANWLPLRFEAVAVPNLRVKLFDGANGIDSDLFDGATVPVTARGQDVIAALYGWDTAIFRPVLVDAAGRLQIDAVIDSLPSIAAATPGNVAVGAVTTVVLALNATRLFAQFVNDSTEEIYLAQGAAAVMNEGIRLNRAGGSFEINLTNLFTGAVNAICASGGMNLTVTEG